MKTVLVTGGTKGIGAAISLRLAKEKFNVVMNYLSDEESATETLRECRSCHSGVMSYKCDVSDSAAVTNMFREIIKNFQTVDVVINNAGLNIDKPILQMSEQDWDRVVDVNMKGTFLVSKAAAEYMLAQETGGHIINVGATTAIAGRKNGVNYCSSKAGVIVMTKCLAKELGPKIRVNCVIPGVTRTEEMEKRLDLPKNEQYEVQRRAIPLSRIGEPFEVANIVNFLISDEAAYLNGQKIIIDGGEYMY